MDGNAKPPCYAINANCRKEPTDCPSFRSGGPCWSTNNVSCCRRNDKSRCCYCSVFLNFRLWVETGLQFRTMPKSFEDEEFKRVSRDVSKFVKSGQCDDSNNLPRMRRALTAAGSARYVQ